MKLVISDYQKAKKGIITNNPKDVFALGYNKYN